MGPTKSNWQEYSGKAPEHGDAAPPSYDDTWQGNSQAAAAATDSKRSHSGPQDVSEPRPTVDSPFNFPPAYTASASFPSGSTSGSAGPLTTGKGGQDYSTLPEVYSTLPEVVTPSGGSSGSSIPSPYVLVAIPQIAPQPTSPFLSAYSSAVLLRKGISSESFTSFLSTLSAFLSATVSERALAHAGDVGRNINNIPKKFSKDTIAHVKGVGQHIGESAKKGNFIAAGIGAIGGAVTIPVAAAFRIVDATVHQLPATIGGLSKKPLSPRERADAYVAVAQKDWFSARGLTVRLCNTAELLLLNAQYRGSGSASGSEAATKELVNLIHRTWERGPVGQLQALQSEFGFAPLDIIGGQPNRDKPLDIGTSTLWLVLIDAPSAT
ncbi:hypothetical protein F4680DRAFT_359579 [Xylaria scruposa]|nr:hypothetical protein F4680DRAFT_359579 [Xylaria scruposa]